jgi:hypothetical protein
MIPPLANAPNLVQTPIVASGLSRDGFRLGWSARPKDGAIVAMARSQERKPNSASNHFDSDWVV